MQQKQNKHAIHMQPQQIKHNTPVPFQIETTTATDQTDTKTHLECLEILRLLPKRRIVCRADFQGQAVIAKLFIHPNKSAADHQRELIGYQHLISAKIITPKLLLSGSLKGTGFYALYEYIASATSLETHITLKPSQSSIAYIKELMPLIAKMHRANIQQIDLHLNNFLVQRNKEGNQLYTIDCGDISLLSQSEETHLLQINKNIADILSQLPIIYDQFLCDFLILYQQESAIKQTASSTAICDQIKQWRKWRIRKYLKKAARSCSEFIHEQNWRTMRVYKREYTNQAWQNFYNNLDRLVENSPRLKDGNTATVALTQCQGKRVVIKRYNIKSFRHWLSRFWRPSRGWRTWQNAHQLIVLGIKTPEPIAIIEQRFGWLRHKAFYISTYEAAEDALTKYSNTDEVTDTHIEDFKTLFTAMIYSRLSHGDLKANNILLTKDGLSIIDLDAMKTHATTGCFKKAFKRDLKRFMQNWPSESRVHRQFKQLLNELPTNPTH